MPSISNLPVELLDQILGYSDQSTLYALTRVSRNLCHIATLHLYKDVDLLIPPGDRIPRIDRLLINLLEHPHLANTVESLRLGLSPKEDILEGQRFLPGLSLHPKIKSLIENEPLVHYGDDLLQALHYGEYGAYAVVLIMALPSLKRLNLFDRQNETLRPLLKLLECVRHSGYNNFHSISGSIEEVCFNCDIKSGSRHKENVQNSKIQLVWKFQGIRRLDIRIPDGIQNVLAHQSPPRFNPLPDGLDRVPLTKLVIRYSGPVLYYLQRLLPATRQLRSLTCELWHDASIGKVEARNSWLSLDTWNACLANVRDTLETLVLSVEFCNSEQPVFNQPIGLQMSGSLDLRTFTKLSTLEVPIPFISGDPHFLIMMPIEPRLPTSLHHLVLRTDMSHAQLHYPFNTSILPKAPSRLDAQDKAEWLSCARMDMSYMASTSVSLADRLSHLKSISVWQPADASLEWFEGQLEDLGTTCKNYGMVAKALYPMLLRWRSAAHWDLVKEMTLFDPAYPERGRFARLLRGEREGVPLGLAAQYHLGEFERRHVLRSRR